MADYRDDIEKYRKGELTSAEMHALEKKALTDPFLADALEGAESISPQDFSFDISEIDQKITSKSNKTVWVTPLRIAAGLVLLMGSFFLIYNFKQPNEQLASKEIPIPTTPRVGDSTSKKDERELLSLNQPKEKAKTETKADLKIETGPVPTKEDGSDEAKPGAGISSSFQTAPAVADDQTKADQTSAAALSEITVEEKILERENMVSTEPVQQNLKKEALDKDIATRSQARKSKLADDIQLQKIVSGQVTSYDDGLPLPGVNVALKGTANGTVTDMQGNYSIPIESGKQKLVFSFIGLQGSEVSLDKKSVVDVKLLEDVSQLSEVVVTSYKSIRDESETTVIKLAEPFGGKKAFDKYLKDNLRFPQQALARNVKGRVIIEFIVGDDGTLRDFQIKKRLGFGCDEEATRLVKDGPIWSPSTEDNIAIESNVRVKMKFDPAKRKK